MKAAVLEGIGQLEVKDTQNPVKEGIKDTIIDVKACGICGSDLSRVMHTGTYNFPTIPGHEFAGIVAEDQGEYKKGDRVAIAPLMPCYHCKNCLNGNFGQCTSYDFLGSRTHGGFAEKVAVPNKNILRLPDNISFEEAGVIEPAAVTLHGIRKLNIGAGDKVVVLGCGSLGLLAVQFAKIMGANEVVAVDLKEKNLKLALEVGATATLNGREVNVNEAIREIYPEGPSVVIETAGVAAVQIQSLEIPASQARILYLGTAHQDVVLKPKTFENIIRKELTIFGSWNSYSLDYPGVDWRSTIQYISQGRLNVKKLVSHTVTLEELPETIKAMAERKLDFTKVVLLNK